MIRDARSTLAATLFGAMLAMPPAAAAQTETRSQIAYRESYALEVKRDFAGAIAKTREATGGSATYFATMRIAWLSYLAVDYAGSATGYTSAIAMEPKAIEPKLGLALAQLGARNWPELERACRAVLAMDAHNATALARLAQANYWSGKYADAASTYQQLSSDYPAELDYKTGLGWALLKMGKPAEARQVFEAVLAVSPDNANAKQGLAVR